MSPPPDDQSAKPKISSAERRQRDADRLQAIRLRMLVGEALRDRGITNPASVRAALGMPAAEATKLLNPKQWRAGDVTLLEDAATRLGLRVPASGPP